MNTEQAYIEGFVKRASEYGFSRNEARLLLKEAIAPTGNQLQNIYAKASGGSAQATNMAPTAPVAPRPTPVAQAQPKIYQSVSSPTGAAYSGVQLPDVPPLPPAPPRTHAYPAAGVQDYAGGEYTPTSAALTDVVAAKNINIPTTSISLGGVKPTVSASIPFDGGTKSQALSTRPSQPQPQAQTQQLLPRPAPAAQAQPQPQSPAPQPQPQSPAPQPQAQAQVEQPLPRPTPLEQTPSTGGLGATQPQRPGQTQKETFVKPTRENPYYSQGARAERAGQYAQHLQSLGKAPINNDASLPSVPRPAPILPEDATPAQLTQSRDTQNANDYVSNLRQARQMADISQNNPAMAAQMQQRISRMDPMVQQAYGKMIPGSMPAAATNNATAGHMDTVDKLRAQGLI